ncbi:hypothetical protein DRQ20_03605 [bacterium]|mgnify:FL=1|nr:MAG: hypothetical protein DRQ20_03605 [bacterium]
MTKKRILVVDDEEHVRESIRLVLEKEGYEVETRENGFSALEAYRDGAFDVVLIDIILPDIDGITLYKRLKLTDPHITAIMISGVKEIETVKEALREGAYDYLIKPLKGFELLSSIKRALERRELTLMAKAYERYLEESLAKEKRELRRLFINTISTLVKLLEARDRYHRGHSERVKNYAERLSELLELSSKEKEKISIAAVLHDVGKVAIPDAILFKPGPLTEEEYETIKEHPVTGEEILRGVIDDEDILLGIRHHHERWDGLGFPDGLKGEEIPFIARVIATADTIDALRSPRAYKRSFNVQETIEALEGDRGKKLDPSLVDIAVKLLKGER